MRILFDFRAYQEFYPRGVSRYVLEIFSQAILHNNESSCILLDSSKVLPQFSDDVKHKIEEFIEVTDLAAAEYRNRFDAFVCGSTIWPALSRCISVDKLYPPAVLSCCRVITGILYDFVPLMFPQYIPNQMDRVNYALQVEATKYLDHVFTISMFTSASGVRYLHRPMADFTCLYGGANSERFSGANSGKPFSAATRTNNIVCITGNAPQKNPFGLVRAFCIAYKTGKLPKDARLYIVCGATDGFRNEISEETRRGGGIYKKNIVATGFIPDDELVALLSTARASFFPSFYEGLGLPILESYAAGTPCFASNLSSTVEFTYPEAGFNPFDDYDIAQAIIKAYTDDELCIKSLAFGQKLIKDINWENGAKIMLEKLAELTEAPADVANIAEEDRTMLVDQLRKGNAFGMNLRRNG